MKVLIVEDEKALRTPMRKFLEKRNFSVEEAEDGATALSLVATETYDCILLDLNLPEIDGITVAKKIREQSHTPIIMVTARSQVYNKLEGFEAGTDDYITKPFDLNELVARIDALIRRSSTNKELELRFGKGLLDVNKNVISIGRKEVLLSNKETALLEYFIRNKGRVISAEELLEHIWGRDVDMFSDTVKTHIKTLRSKIDPKKNLIKTIRGKGYLYE